MGQSEVNREWSPIGCNRRVRVGLELEKLEVSETYILTPGKQFFFLTGIVQYFPDQEFSFRKEASYQLESVTIE